MARTYTLTEIDWMRSLLEAMKTPNKEQVLQTYLSQGVSPVALENKYTEWRKNQKK